MDERFWSRVDKSGDCWIWTGYRDRKTYGIVERRRDGRRETRAHRWAWILTHGPIPDGLFVLHRCDNPPCVRPDHLWLGTTDDNMADMAAKGRAHRVKTPEHIQAIADAQRRRYREHPERHPETMKTHCKRGHPFDEANTRRARGQRQCRACHRDWQRQYRAMHRTHLLEAAGH